MDAEQRAAWLEQRRSMIGSSDAAAVLGLSKYRSPLHVYISKVNPPEEDARSGDPCEWGPRDFGNYFEAEVARLYQIATGRVVVPPARPILRMPDRPYVGCSLDRVAFAPDEPVRIVECKTSDEPMDWGKEGTDEMPDDIVTQTQHQLLVTGFERADVPVLLSGNDFRIYQVVRSERFHERMLTVYDDFWKKVENLTPPDWDWQHPETPALVKKLYAEVLDEVVSLGGDALMIADAYRAARAERLKVEKTEAALKARLLAQMGLARLANLPDGTRMRRSMVERESYTVAPGGYVKFTISEPKE